MKSLSETKLTDLLPPNLAADEDILAKAEAFDAQFGQLVESIEQPAIYMRIDQLTSLQLDHLAVQYDVTPWRESWSISMKRSVIRATYMTLCKRGTVEAVKTAVEALGSAVQIIEWWQMEPKGTPHTFKVVTNLGSFDGVVSSDLQNDVMALIDNAKPVRAHYTLELRESLEGIVGTAGLVESSVVARISDC